MVFQRTYIYVKEHNETGLKYFGKTCKEDYHKYRGSGLHWTHHIKKHGYNVSTNLLGIFDNKEECIIYCLSFSKINNIVKCKKWANLIEENGCDGGVFGSTRSEETKQKMSHIQRGKKRSDETKHKMSISKFNMSAETKQQISRAHLGKKLSEETKHKMSISKLNMSDETKHKMSISKLNMSDETKQKMSISRIGKKHSEETKQKISISQLNMSDKTKQKMSISRIGKKHSEETKQKMGNQPKIYKCFFCKSQKMKLANFIHHHNNGNCLFK